MKSPPRVITMDVPLPLPIFLALCEHREKTGCKQEIPEMTAAAVRDWLAARERETQTAAGRPSLNGFQWKELYLPDGTVLRTVFQGQNYYATVVGDKILFDERALSPSEFANSFGGAVRNAWKVIWLLLPGATDWKLASALRKRLS